MNKDFETWTWEKKFLDTRKETIFYVNIREIWQVKMRINIGFEENGKEQFLRPVLVLKKIWNLFLTVALTSKGKEKHTFYHKFQTVQLHNPKYQESSYVILSQIKVMDKKRFFENVGTLPEEEFFQVQKKLRDLHF